MKHLLLVVLLSLSFTAFAEEVQEVPTTEPFESLSVADEAVVEVEDRQVLTGIASWYGPGFHGRKTADGTRYNQYGISAASNHLPLGAWVRVTHLESGLNVVLKITDRMAVNNPRVIDLSVGAAKVLNMLKQGIAQVAIQVLDPATEILTTGRR